MHGCPPEKAHGLRRDVAEMLVEPILGITLPDHMDQLESESFEKMLGMMGG